jgi:predicted permease
MNQEFFYIIILIGIGYLFKRLGILKERDGEVISRVIFNITLPALIIVSLNSVQIEPSLLLLLFSSSEKKKKISEEHS